MTAAMDQPCDVQGLTLFQGCVTVANILLGAGLLSLPYAMTLSGWSGVLVIALCCLLFNTSGKFISWGLDMLPRGLTAGYPELGFAAYADAGRHMVTAAAGLELFGGACMELLILWRSLQLIPDVAVERHCPPWLTKEGLAILLGCALEVPLCLWGTLKSLSWVSASGVLSTCAVTGFIVALPLFDPHREYLQEPGPHHTTGNGIFAATGIMALSVAGHSTFPSVRSRMADTALFPAALNCAYVIACIVTCTIAGIGYWYWGDSAQILVTEDFEKHSPYMGVHVMGIGIHHIVQVLVALNVGTTVPLLLLPLVDILQSVFRTARNASADSPVPSGDLQEPLLAEEGYSSNQTLPSIDQKMPSPSPLLCQPSLASHPIAIQLVKDWAPLRIPPPPDVLSPRTRQCAGFFSPRSRGILAALTPRRKDVVLAAFPPALLRGLSGHSMASSAPFDHVDTGVTSVGGDEETVPQGEAFKMRAALLVLLCGVSGLTRKSLGSVEAVVGAVCVVLSSLMLPTLFYVGLHRKRRSVGPRLWAVAGFILTFGAALMALIIVQTLMKMVEFGNNS